MDYEVVVVGGGIGGLTTAALLAARGVKVCLFERQSNVGGCVANVEHLGYTFEPTAGLYSGWQPAGIYDRIFSELPFKPPEVRRLSPPYVVRLPDRTDVRISEDWEQFTDILRESFPECAERAVSFYRELFDVNEVWQMVKSPSKGSTRTDSQEFSSVRGWGNQMTTELLLETSTRFQRFIDVQLQTFTQCADNECSLLRAAVALTAPHRGMWAIRGGAQALADALAESLKESGGVLRLNSPVLRLAYGSDGLPTGIDLLSGERVTATRAIVSNLTIWDTYGKLVGLSRTPASIAVRLKGLRAWGAYLLFLGMDAAAASLLNEDHILVLTDWRQEESYAPHEMQLVFAAAPEWDARAPSGQRAVTVSTFTQVDDWFAFHQDETAHEAQDQAALETWWKRLHSALPELRDSVEVIETATPRTFYETTRRKLGMVGGLPSDSADSPPLGPFGITNFPNLFIVGDTVSFAPGMEAVCASALALADHLAPS